jgi:DNA-binding transcriptional MocR family regulator
MPTDEAVNFAAAAARLNITVTPPNAVMVDPEEESSGVRLCLGGPSFDDLTKALTLLSDLGGPNRTTP